MSTRHGLLALLAQGPRHGYQLRVGVRGVHGGDPAAQHRPGLHDADPAGADGLVTQGEQDEQGRVVYSITEAGRRELERWFATPVVHADRPRDELVIKLAMAVTTPGVDARAVDPRPAHRDDAPPAGADQAKRDGERTGGHGTAYRLVLDSLIFQAEAEQRWLDHCEALLAPGPATPRPTTEEER